MVKSDFKYGKMHTTIQKIGVSEFKELSYHGIVHLISNMSNIM